MVEFSESAVKAAAKANPAFRLAARGWNGDVLFRFGNDGYRLKMRGGDVVSFAPDPSDPAAEIVIAGPADAWEKLLLPVPPAPYVDPLFVGYRVGFRSIGNYVEHIAPYYAALSEFLAILRRLHSGPPPSRPIADVHRKFDAAVGRYVYITLSGVQHRIYFEEAGAGRVPLLLQHTAGADGSQWRHLLEDPDFQRMFRMIAYDLPYHAKSHPPTSIPWWEREYVLTRERLIETVVAISRALELDRPVYMGCSVGGHLAPDLAYYCPENFRAVVGINSGLGSGLNPGEPSELELSFKSARVGAAWNGAANYTLTSPVSPEAYRREVAWGYNQGAPGIIAGDTYYYSYDHDLTQEQARQIDTAKVPVYLLTAEYDPMAFEDGTARLAKAIPGAHFQMLPGLGHFGPAENPEDFKKQTLPLFEDIAKIP